MFTKPQDYSRETLHFAKHGLRSALVYYYYILLNVQWLGSRDGLSRVALIGHNIELIYS
jgi:hypothetical protein